MNKTPIQLVVADLDNTLYDWVTFFATAFYAMVGKAAETLAVSEDQLLDELREVHRRHHNSEHPFALLETDTVLHKFPDASRGEMARHLDEAFHEFNRVRKQTLCLYDSVASTLRRLQELRVPVVAHTEATVPNALFRLKKLEIDEYFPRLYAVEPSGPGHHDPQRQEELLQTHIEVRYLGQGERKPDPRVLLDICRDMNTAPTNTLYVGDSVSRDVGMAKAAGVWAAWAEYGTRYDSRMWDRLVRITHWTEEDVKRAQEAKRLYGETKPDAVLSESLGDIFDAFTFEANGHGL